MSDALIDVFLMFRNLVKVYHWKTKSYARHVASDSLVGGLDKLVDEFMEVYFGKYNSEVHKITRLKTTFEVRTEDSFIDQELNYFRTMVIPEIRKILNPTADSDLFNILDEMSALINRTVYLFGLK